MHPTTKALLKHFHFDHLPAHLHPVARENRELADSMACQLDGPHLAEGLRRLIQAKEYFIKAAIEKREALDARPSP